MIRLRLRLLYPLIAPTVADHSLASSRPHVVVVGIGDINAIRLCLRPGGLAYGSLDRDALALPVLIAKPANISESSEESPALAVTAAAPTPTAGR